MDTVNLASTVVKGRGVGGWVRGVVGGFWGGYSGRRGDLGYDVV